MSAKEKVPIPTTPEPIEQSSLTHDEWKKQDEIRISEAHRLQIETERRLNQSGLLEVFIDAAKKLRQSHPSAHVHLMFPPGRYTDTTLTLRLAWNVTRSTDPRPDDIEFDTATCRIRLEHESADSLRIEFGEDRKDHVYYRPFHDESRQANSPTVIRSDEPDFITRSTIALTELIKNPQFAKARPPYSLLGRADKVAALFFYIIDYSVEREDVRLWKPPIKIIYPKPEDIIIRNKSNK